MSSCTRCDSYLLSSEKCYCKPFQIKHEYYGDESYTIYAHDVEAAIEKAAEKLYSDYSGDIPASDMEETFECEGKKYVVTGDYQPVFYVRELSDVLSPNRNR